MARVLISLPFQEHAVGLFAQHAAQEQALVEGRGVEDVLGRDLDGVRAGLLLAVERRRRENDAGDAGPDSAVMHIGQGSAVV